MRTPLARLIGLTAAASLIVTPLVFAGPAHAAPGMGPVTITVADDLGQPVKSLVILVDSDGDEYELSLPTPGGSTYTEDVPEGDYAVVAFGGWNGITCAGTETCEIGVSGPSDLPEFKSAVLHVQSGTPATYKLTTQTPTLTGGDTVGSILETVVPDALGSSVGGVFGGLESLYGIAASPGVTWLRNGQRIPGEGDTVYTLTKADAGSSITAKVTYPALYRMLFASLTSGVDISPAPASLGPVAVTKNASTTSVRVVGKLKANKLTTVWISVSGAGPQVTGWLQVRATGLSPIRTRVRDGFAQVKLPLRAGKRTVKAQYLGSGDLTPSTDAKTVRVKKATKGKKKG